MSVLRELPSQSAHTAVTSPPYYGLRDYGLSPVSWGGKDSCSHEVTNQTCVRCGAWIGQLGMEPSPRLYVSHLVTVFSEVKRVLRDDGTLWVVIGDSYSRGSREDMPPQRGSIPSGDEKYGFDAVRILDQDIKPKDLVGVPWLFAFAMRESGWYLRSDIVWSKPNPMPESIEDRPTKSHEYVFLFSKSSNYYYDYRAILEPMISTPKEYENMTRSVRKNHAYGSIGGAKIGDKSFQNYPVGRNKRTVWSVASQPYAGAHYAPFPPKLIEPAILAGTSGGGVCQECLNPFSRVKSDGSPDSDSWIRSCSHEGAPVPATVLDPFAGSGTTGMVAQGASRRAVLIDLNGDYVQQQLIRNSNIPLGL